MLNQMKDFDGFCGKDYKYMKGEGT